MASTISAGTTTTTGLVYSADTSGVLQLQTNGGTTAVTIDTNQNVGVGVTPSAWSTAGTIEFTGNYATGYNGHSQNAYNSSGGWKYLTTAAASVYQQGSGAHKWFNAPSGTAGNAITFTQAMTLDNSGNLLVGTTSFATPGFAVNPLGYFFLGNNAQASGWAFATFQRSGTTIGSISQTGTTAVLYNTTSEQRLKEYIVDAHEFVSVIDSIKVRSYNWKSDGSHQRAGFVAQELVTVAPEAVHQPADPEEMMAVDYSKLVPMLVKEIQSLRKRILTLENK